jgi:peroxiredoxin Q/BCP
MPDQSEVQIGTPAPDFSLPCSTGELVRLSDFRGKSEVVLFFYPKDNSPACTAQACSFRDHYEAFRDAGAEVIGISSDSETSHQRFARLWKLPFFLVSDSKGEVRARYRVSRTLGLFPGRVTYLIDREGVIRHIFSSQLQPGRHVTEMLEALRKLRGNSSNHGEVSPSP